MREESFAQDVFDVYRNTIGHNFATPTDEGSHDEYSRQTCDEKRDLDQRLPCQKDAVNDMAQVIGLHNTRYASQHTSTDSHHQADVLFLRFSQEPFVDFHTPPLMITILRERQKALGKSVIWMK